MAGDILKRVWQHSPQWVRQFFLVALCSLRAQKRHVSLPECEPVFICGAFYNSSGIAQGARLYSAACKTAGKRGIMVDITGAMRMPRNYTSALDGTPLTIAQARELDEEGTVVIHANPPQFQLALCALGKAFLRNKRVVAYWVWELEKIPSSWLQALPYVDAIEAPSVFVRDALQQYTAKEIRLFPYKTPRPARQKTSFAPDGIVRCLFAFDAASSFERKNPLAALQAFSQAFSAGEAELTFKVSNARSASRKFEALREACSLVPGARIITDIFTPEQLSKLYLEHDIYLSLHRSEGFGLTIHEAMLHGLHVVATGWSANMDFMKGPLAHAVPYTLVPVRLDSGPYKGLNVRWAEADTRAAAKILQDLREQLLAGQRSGKEEPF